MDFELSDEQRLLKESVERLLSGRYDFESRLTYGKLPEGWSRDIWRSFAELGLLGLPFDEAHGGFGAGPVETMIVMEAFGRALVLEPYLATVVLAGGLIRLGGSEQQKAELLPKIAAGDIVMAFAHAERHARYDLHHVEVSAQQDGGSWIINGEKSLVLDGDSADQLIVSARVAGDKRDASGIALFLVDAAASGVSRRGYPTQDGRRAAEISFSSVRVPQANLIGTPGEASPLIERVTAEAIAALSAEAVGAMHEMHAVTVDYLKTRKQFGAPIGNFQVLQHRAADMFVALEQARSMAMLATMMTQETDAAARSAAISAAKAQVGRSARLIGQAAVQLHGGVGMTMEYKIGHYFKRVTMIDILFGDADHHVAKVAAAGGLITA
jgi:pimeloyl-CoA dehydrogenase small subunit